MNIIILGQPGVGKGTIAGMITKKYGLMHLSCGDILRKNLKLKTELGLKAQPYMEEGTLVPDEIIIQMMLDRIGKEDSEKYGFLLDGYPRTIEQAESLKEQKIDIILNLKASEKTIVERLSGRRICKECGAIFHLKNMPPKEEGVCDKCGGQLYQRPDEKPDVIKTRLETYHKETEPLIKYYEERVKNIDAEGSPNEIFADVKKVIDAVVFL